MLKTRIKSSGLPYFSYQNPSALAEKVKEILTQAIEQDFPKEEDPDPIEVTAHTYFNALVSNILFS